MDQVGKCCGRFRFSKGACIENWVFNLFSSVASWCVRISKLYNKMEIPLPPRKDRKKTAKIIKGWMVMLKKKLNRDVLCRSQTFQNLMALVFIDNEQDWGEEK